VEGLEVRLAGGTIGVTAAMNEAAFETNKLVLPLVFLLIFLSVMVFYRSLHAGFLMFLAMLFATTLTYAYMGVTGVGININTVPIVAVGVGVGIDYSIYMMDRIREQMDRSGSLKEAVRAALATTGLAISFTALTLIAGIVMWIFLSDLRFQADAALLLSVMVILNALAALFLIPAWVLLFRPRFIAGVGAETARNMPAGQPAAQNSISS
jgi:predicted RND superfamily exporter protein